jgi:Right handed beta helix region
MVWPIGRAEGSSPPEKSLGPSLTPRPRPPWRKEIRMTARRLNATLILGLASLIFLGTDAQAQTANRTFVSGTGSDTNPCTRALPCQTLPFAINQVATGGEVYVIDALDTPGIFVPFTITKSVSIIGAGARSGITGAFTVAPEAGGQVLLKGLDINALGSDGILVQTSGITLVVDDCTIVNGSFGITFAPSGTATSNLVVRNSTISRNNAAGSGSTTAGIFIQPVSTGTTGRAVAVIENTNINNNTYGIRAFDYSNVTVRNSVVTQSTWAGIRSEQQPSVLGPVTVFVEHTQVSHNGGNGVVAYGSPTATMRLLDVTITDNGAGIAYFNGGIVYSFGNNGVSGNVTTSPPTLIPLT